MTCAEGLLLCPIQCLILEEQNFVSDRAFATCLTVSLKGEVRSSVLRATDESSHTLLAKSQWNKACIIVSGSLSQSWHMGDKLCILAAKTALTGNALCTAL